MLLLNKKHKQSYGTDVYSLLNRKLGQTHCEHKLTAAQDVIQE